MIPQGITSFFENTKEKISNPFFGTLIFVWIVRNWELVYSFFNFDDGFTLDDKKAFIRNYYSNKSFLNEFLSNIGIAFGLMVIGYILILVTRIVMNFGENKIMPHIVKITNSKKIITRDRYEEVSRERDLYFNTLESERNNTVKLEQSHSHFKNEVSRLTTAIDTLNDDKSRLVEKNIELETSLSKSTLSITQLRDNKNILESKLNALEEMTIASNKLFYHHNVSYEATQKYFYLSQEDSMVTFFKSIADNIVTNKSYSDYNSNVVDKFVNQYLMKIKDYEAENLYSTENLQLTKIGEELYENIEIISKLIKEESLF